MPDPNVQIRPLLPVHLRKCQKGYQTRVRNPGKQRSMVSDQTSVWPSVKKVRTPGFKGSTQEKSPFEISHFGYKTTVNNKKVPDPVGSGVTYLLSE